MLTGHNQSSRFFPEVSLKRILSKNIEVPIFHKSSCVHRLTHNKPSTHKGPFFPTTVNDRPLSTFIV